MPTSNQKPGFVAHIKLYLQRPVEPESLSWPEARRILQDVTFETVLGLNHSITEFHLNERKRAKHWRETGENLPKEAVYNRIYAETREIMKTASSGMASTVVRASFKRYRNSAKDILSFRQSIPSYKLGHPILLRVGAGETKIWSEQGKYYFRSAFQNGNHSPTRISFLLNTFKLEKSRKAILDRIISGEYKLGACQVVQDNDKRWYARIAYSYTKGENQCDPSVCVGLNIGLTLLFCCAVNNGVGSLRCDEADIIQNLRKQIRKRKSVFQNNLKYSSRVGHGTKKTIAPMMKLLEKEKKFRSTKYHQYTSRIVEFAINHNAKVIQIEGLESVRTDSGRILRDWAIADFYQKLKYKAQREGIDIREIDAGSAYFECSECGNRSEVYSKEKSIFSCAVCEYETHADYNAARNMARIGFKKPIAITRSES